MDKTKLWEALERGKKYYNSLSPNYYVSVKTNRNFFRGLHWEGIETNGGYPPVLNWCKRAIQMMVASITSSKIAIQYSPLLYRKDEDPVDPNQEAHKEASDIVTAEVNNILEKVNMDNRYRDAMYDGAITGDYYGHWIWDSQTKPFGGTLDDADGVIDFELIEGTSVHLGNPNNPKITTKTQPYVLITGRDLTENLRAEAKYFKSQENPDSDSNMDYMTTNNSNIEIQADEYGKSTYVIGYSYDRKTKTIKVSKSTQNAYIYQDIDTGLSFYPVTSGKWERINNQAPGLSLIEGIIPNQIVINIMLFLIQKHQMLNAFQKPIFNADKISEWNNDIGKAIPVKDLLPGDNVRNFAAYLQSGDISAAIVRVFEMTIQYTKEVLGINDAMTGSINPGTASGTAIAMTVQQSNIPLDNPKANLYEWVEDNGRVILDMITTYYGKRSIVIDGKMQKYDFGKLKGMWLNTKCDVGPSSYWSEQNQVDMLNNLLAMKDPNFDMITFLESLPENYQNKELNEKIKDKIAEAKKMADDQAVIDQAKQTNDPNKAFDEFMNGLSPELQQAVAKESQSKVQENPNVNLDQLIGKLGG
ncbi:MAG: hypothetical protein WCL51_03655 [Bacteroidota bacterium]